MIMAIISVPPLEAPILNRIAVPIAGRKIANISSRSGSVVRGCVMGYILSSTERLTDMTTVAYTVFKPKLLPRKIKPRTRSAIFIMDVKSLADH